MSEYPCPTLIMTFLLNWSLKAEMVGMVDLGLVIMVSGHWTRLFRERTRVLSHRVQLGRMTKIAVCTCSPTSFLIIIVALMIIGCFRKLQVAKVKMYVINPSGKVYP
ncbi:hypothetical protein EDB19DRAFT_1745844 [Suillus lakei]|nr:hypothetical protein EDB19DRAFT_1745844 [Suillus lakei]